MAHKIFAFVLALPFLLLSPAQSIAQEVQLRFLFFDEAGKQLDYASTVKRMTNGHPEYLSTGAFELDTLKAVELHNSYNDGRGWLTVFKELSRFPRQGIFVHWNTKSTGYSSFLLDNEGKGFTRGGVVIFNERLALDARRHLRLALDARPELRLSEKLRALLKEADSCHEELGKAKTASQRGLLGQQCLDLSALAMRLLMFEAGLDNARKHPQPKWGITIEPNEDMSLEEERAKLDALNGLFKPNHTWIRVAMFGDGKDDLGRIRAIVKMARERGFQVMGQLFDSHRQNNLSLDVFKRRVDEVINDSVFSMISAWEIGNEVNGGWLGAEMPSKIRYASSAVRARSPEKRLCVTFYWYSAQDTMVTSLFNWIEKNIFAEGIEDAFDCAGLSIYTGQAPLGFLLDRVSRRLADIFPDKELMIGEADFDYFPYREGPLDWSLEQLGQEYVRMRYAEAFAMPRSFGGVFWWSFEKSLQRDTPMRRALRAFYCEAYPMTCSP